MQLRKANITVIMVGKIIKFKIHINKSKISDIYIHSVV